MQYLPSIAGVAVFSLMITRLLIPVSRLMGLLDCPNQRKTHQGNVPLIGGISIYLSLVSASAAFLHLPDTFIGIALITGLITSVGALDDRYPLQAVYRLVLQLIAGVAIASIGVKIDSLGNLFGLGNVQLWLLAIPFTAMAITGLCNAYNMVDGIDGLAGSLTLVAIVGLIYLTLGRAAENEVLLLMFLATSVCVFLLFNLTIGPFFTTKIFMGDAGSMFLGCAVAIAMIYFSQGEQAAVNPVTALWLVAIPLMDMLSTMLRRLSKNKSPFHADRTHLHHILMRGGLSQHQALISITLTSTGCAIFGIFVDRIWPQSEAISFVLFILLFATYFNFVFKHAFKFAKGLRRRVQP